ncbi:hypothetical protein NSMM_420007 [Nitrosomonas mobilis]|uniref:Uncharacterized protein n=1 Tax=Nitrosomonas mobilis TaxID=51642 RepID=A0A1G5SHM1_9PROT|nr:hypothetical protein NSMM_420007 [Nitrosomonas mobilis]
MCVKQWLHILSTKHVVPLAYANQHGAGQWTRTQGRVFANDYENMLVVHSATQPARINQTKHRMNGHHL